MAPGRGSPYDFTLFTATEDRLHSLRLTQREKQVLALIGEALSSTEIAHKLGISVATVRKHRENLMQKLDLHNTAELVLYAIRRELGD